MELLIATRNPGKIDEMQNLLKSLAIKQQTLSEFPEIIEPEETGGTFIENASLKAEYYALETGLMSLADDSGLEVDALSGAPGVLSARYAGHNSTSQQKIEKLLSEMANSGKADKNARFVCAMSIAGSDGKILYSAEGVCHGTIAIEPRGNGGFGYDPVFIPAGYDHTFGELSTEIKGLISHRSLAISKIIAYLRAFHAS